MAAKKNNAVETLKRYMTPLEGVAKKSWESIMNLKDDSKREELLKKREIYWELEECLDMIKMCDYSNFEIVSNTDFDQKLQNADSSSVEFVGEYVKAAFIDNFPNPKRTILVAIPAVN